MRYLLDTSAILAHYRQEAGWNEVQDLFENDEAQLCIASVSLTEFGRRLRELGATESECEAAISAYLLLFGEVAAIDVATARAGFFIGCRTPERVPLVDALIAAAAQIRGAVLVHRDAHMRSIPSDLVLQQELALAPPQ